MIDTVRKLFRLTLDNVYRFLAAVVGLTAVVALVARRSPLAQLEVQLSWLGVPSGWIESVSVWIDARSAAVAFVATLMLGISVWVASEGQWRRRAGATVWLSSALLIQTGWSASILGGIVGVPMVLGASAWLAHSVARRTGRSAPSWPAILGKRVANVIEVVVLSLIGALAPVFWLIGEEPDNALGSAWNPLHVRSLAELEASTGAVRR